MIDLSWEIARLVLKPLNLITTALLIFCFKSLTYLSHGSRRLQTTAGLANKANYVYILSFITQN